MPFDLTRFEAVVEAETNSWKDHGITWSFTWGKPYDKQAAWLNCEWASGLLSLIIWDTGEAELTTIASGDEPRERSFEDIHAEDLEPLLRSLLPSSR